MEENAIDICGYWYYKGCCRFGDTCRNAHAITLIRITNLHEHPCGPDKINASKRKKNFCNQCNKKSKGDRYRCVAGCDFDLCYECFNQADPQEVTKDL